MCSIFCRYRYSYFTWMQRGVCAFLHVTSAVHGKVSEVHHALVTLLLLLSHFVASHEIKSQQFTFSFLQLIDISMFPVRYFTNGRVFSQYLLLSLGYERSIEIEHVEIYYKWSHDSPNICAFYFYHSHVSVTVPEGHSTSWWGVGLTRTGNWLITSTVRKHGWTITPQNLPPVTPILQWGSPFFKDPHTSQTVLPVGDQVCKYISLG